MWDNLLEAGTLPYCDACNGQRVRFMMAITGTS